MGVSTFSLGFGPKVWGRMRGKTEYRLSAVPLGGYVALVGEDDEAEIPEGFTRKESFAHRPPWQRLLVVAAGPLANILLAWLLCWGLAYTQGAADILPHIGGIEADSPAAAAGLKSGDTVISVNGAPVTDWTALSEHITRSQGAPLTVVVDREGGPQTLTVTPKTIMRKTIFGEEKPLWQVGIRASGQMSHRELGFFSAAVAGAQRTWEMGTLIWQGMVKLVQRVVPLDQVGGPIMIAQMVGEQAKEGLPNVLALTALISINLAILNLLPIPVLDGGHILFFALETVMRRPLSQRIRTVTTQAGFLFLIGLMVLATFNDVWRIIKNFGGLGG